MRPEFSLPDFYTERVQSLLAANGADLKNSPAVAAAVRKLSDFYIANPAAPTPYEHPWARVAYAAYFFPLNYVRARAVIHEGTSVGFFADLRSAQDFGSGPGTLTLALLDAAAEKAPWQEVSSVERSSLAINMHKALLGNSPTPHHWEVDINSRAGAPGQGRSDANHRLNAFCYSFTELEELPRWALDAEALLIIEPATQTDGRRLMEHRKKIMEAGFRIWGPCTHEGECPLLVGSKRDWCHDRITWTMPPWFTAIEAHLPMKNRTLTFSWLLARRASPPADLRELARLTGDLQREKGASKQMVCRGSSREFLSWQHKNGVPPEFPRGSLIRIRAGVPMKSNELRPQPGDCTLAES